MIGAWAAGMLFVAGWIFFPGAFVLQRYLWFQTKSGSKLMKQYMLTRKDCIDISNKVVSALQAICASVSGMIICSHCYNDVLHNAHPMTTIYAWFGIPYFIYDAFAMFYVYRSGRPGNERIVAQLFNFFMHSPVLIFHHIGLAPLGFSLVTFYRDGVNNGDFFVGIIYLMETSTPFLSLRFILSKLKMKSSLLYVANGILMLLLFPVFRICSVFYTVKMHGDQVGKGYWQTFNDIPDGWKIIFLMAVTPQIHWCFMLYRGLFKMLSNPKPSKAKSCDPQVDIIRKHSTSYNIHPDQPNSLLNSNVCCVKDCFNT